MFGTEIKVISSALWGHYVKTYKMYMAKRKQKREKLKESKQKFGSRIKRKKLSKERIGSYGVSWVRVC